MLCNPDIGLFVKLIAYVRELVIWSRSFECQSFICMGRGLVNTFFDLISSGIYFNVKINYSEMSYIFFPPSLSARVPWNIWYPSYYLWSNGQYIWGFFSFSLSFYGHALGMWKFPDHGPCPCHSNNLSLCSDKARLLTRWAIWVIFELMFRKLRWTMAWLCISIFLFLGSILVPSERMNFISVTSTLLLLGFKFFFTIYIRINSWKIKMKRCGSILNTNYILF